MFQLTDFPTFEYGQSFTIFRRQFYHALAKSNLKETPDEYWEFCHYNCLVDWTRRTLLWQSLQREAKIAATAAGLNPRHYDIHKFDKYAEALHNFFEDKTPRNYFEEFYRDLMNELHEDKAIEQLFS